MDFPIGLRDEDCAVVDTTVRRYVRFFRGWMVLYY